MKIKNCLTQPRAEDTYLRLDCTNDPLTGDLESDYDISLAPQVEYALHDFCFSFGGIDYDADPMVGFTCSLWWDGVNPNPIMAGTVTDPAINGINDIDCGLYWLNVGFVVYLTFYYAAGEKANLEAWINAMTGGAWGCDDFVAPMFQAVGGVYNFTGYPVGWTPAPAYMGDPLIETLAAYTTRLLDDGRVYTGLDLQTGRDLHVDSGGWAFIEDGRLVFGQAPTTDILNGAGWSWNPSVTPNEYYALFWGGNPQIWQVRYALMDDEFIVGGTPGALGDHQYGHGDADGLGFDTMYVRDDTGNPDVTGVVVSAALVQPLLPGMSDCLIQAFQQLVNPAGGAVAFILGFQDSSNVDNFNQCWAMNFGISNYGARNNWAPVYGVQSSYRLGHDNHLMVLLNMISTRFTMADGGGGSNINNVGSLTFYEAQDSREGGSVLSHETIRTLFMDNTNFDWSVDHAYTLYARNHGGVCADSWGVYNLDRTYLDDYVDINDYVDHVGDYIQTGLHQTTHERTSINPGDLTACQVRQNFNPSGVWAGDVPAFRIEHFVNTNGAFSNVSSLEVNVEAASGADNITELKAGRFIVNVNDSYSGNIDILAGNKSLHMLPPGAYTVDDIYYYWAHSMGFNHYVERQIAFEAWDLDENSVQLVAGKPSYWGFAEEQTNEPNFWMLWSVSTLRIGSDSEMLLAPNSYIEIDDAKNVLLGTSTGTQFATAANQKLAFYGQTPCDQPLTVADPAGGMTVDAECRTAVSTVIDRLQELGLIA